MLWTATWNLGPYNSATSWTYIKNGGIKTSLPTSQTIHIGVHIWIQVALRFKWCTIVLSVWVFLIVVLQFVHLLPFLLLQDRLNFLVLLHFYFHLLLLLYFIVIVLMLKVRNSTLSLYPSSTSPMPLAYSGTWETSSLRCLTTVRRCLFDMTMDYHRKIWWWWRRASRSII